MLSDEQGAQAIIDLQATVGITETKEEAEIGWSRMRDIDKVNTELAHKLLGGEFKIKWKKPCAIKAGKNE